MKDSRNFFIEDHGQPISFEQALVILKTHKRELPERVLDKCYDVTFAALMESARQVGLEYFSLAFGDSANPAIEVIGDKSEYRGWPAVWEVTRRLKINSCGNSNQSQVHFGVFDKRHRGKWNTQTGQLMGDPDECLDRVITERPERKPRTW